MPEKRTKNNQIKAIQQALKTFPKIVKQNEKRGRSHRKLMKAFEPMAKDLALRIRAEKKASSSDGNDDGND